MTLDLSGGKAYYRIDPDAHPIQTTQSPGASGAIWRADTAGPQVADG